MKKDIKTNRKYSNDTKCVVDFIEKIWNEKRYDQTSTYLHSNYIDYSIPFVHMQNEPGLIFYLKGMSKKVLHTTTLLSIEQCEDLIICLVSINIRPIDEQQSETKIEGCRVFKMFDNKIISHYEEF